MEAKHTNTSKGATHERTHAHEHERTRARAGERNKPAPAHTSAALRRSRERARPPNHAQRSILCARDNRKPARPAHEHERGALPCVVRAARSARRIGLVCGRVCAVRHHTRHTSPAQRRAPHAPAHERTRASPAQRPTSAPHERAHERPRSVEPHEPRAASSATHERTRAPLPLARESDFPLDNRPHAGIVPASHERTARSERAPHEHGSTHHTHAPHTRARPIAGEPIPARSAHEPAPLSGRAKPHTSGSASETAHAKMAGLPEWQADLPERHSLFANSE